MITVAGQDLTASLQADFQPQLAAMTASGRFLKLPPGISALRLRSAVSEADYARVMSRLLQHRNHVDLQAFEIPRRPGRRGRLVSRFKQLLWKVLRYQHDRVCFRQNLVNSHVTALLAFQGERFDRELAELRDRVAALEHERASDVTPLRHSA